MAAPSGWELPDDLPDEWEEPPDLRFPTPYPEVNMAIKLLSRAEFDFLARAAIGRFITEEALYDVWFLENRWRSGWDARKSALLGEVPMEQTRTVYEIWKVYERIGDLGLASEQEGEQRRVVLARLTAALDRAADTFAGLRAGQDLE